MYLHLLKQDDLQLCAFDVLMSNKLPHSLSHIQQDEGLHLLYTKVNDQARHLPNTTKSFKLYYSNHKKDQHIITHIQSPDGMSQSRHE